MFQNIHRKTTIAGAPKIATYTQKKKQFKQSYSATEQQNSYQTPQTNKYQVQYQEWVTSSEILYDYFWSMGGWETNKRPPITGDPLWYPPELENKMLLLLTSHT